jgi:ubiquinone biosynthesis monooxygenase Coq7
VAVESVVLRHLESQLREFDGVDPAAHAAVASIDGDERSHHDRAAQEPRQGIFWPRLIRPAVSTATVFVIWSGMRLSSRLCAPGR